MDLQFRDVIWHQFGAAIDMLENAINACPEEVWNDRSRNPQFWYVAFHTLFWLDLYLADSLETFTPPAPFTIAEIESEQVPETPYTKAQLQKYLEHGRRQCREWISGVTDDQLVCRCPFEWVEGTNAELMLYNMRHVQHHAAQLNLILRQTIDSAPGWVAKVKM
ncbi:MAG TPA: DinB family protein [Pyrinomonadaceae bacterium]|jgi:uncharacterized damage-inducible protein DinB